MSRRRPARPTELSRAPTRRPSTVLRRFAELVADGTLARHALATVVRLALASALTGVITNPSAYVREALA